MKKRLMCVLLTLALVLSMLPTVAFGAWTTEPDSSNRLYLAQDDTEDSETWMHLNSALDSVTVEANDATQPVNILIYSDDAVNANVKDKWADDGDVYTQMSAERVGSVADGDEPEYTDLTIMYWNDDDATPAVKDRHYNHNSGTGTTTVKFPADANGTWHISAYNYTATSKRITKDVTLVNGHVDLPKEKLKAPTATLAAKTGDDCGLDLTVTDAQNTAANVGSYEVKFTDSTGTAVGTTITLAKNKLGQAQSFGATATGVFKPNTEYNVSVVAKPADTTAFEDSDAGTATATTGRLKLTIDDVNVTDNTKTYNKNAQTATVAYKNTIVTAQAGTLVVTYKQSGATVAAPTNAGTYDIVVSAVEGNYYKALAEGTHATKFVIAQATQAKPTLSKDNDASAAGNDGAITITGTPEAGNGWEYKKDGGAWTDVTGNKLENLVPGTYTVRAKADAAGNYKDGAEETITINGTDPRYEIKAPVAIAFDDAVYGYAQPAAKVVEFENTGNQDLNLNFELTGANDGDFTLSALTEAVTKGGKSTITVRPNAGLDAGTYTATIKATDAGGNAATKTVTVTFKVTPKEVTVAPKAAITKQYDNTTALPADVEWVVKVDGAEVAGLTATVNAAYASKDVDTNIDITGTATRLTGTGSENYTLKADVATTGNITKADATLEFADASLSQRQGSVNPALVKATVKPIDESITDADITIKFVIGAEEVAAGGNLADGTPLADWLNAQPANTKVPVKANFAGNTNLNAADEIEGKLTITAKSSGGSSSRNFTVTYSAGAHGKLADGASSTESVDRNEKPVKVPEVVANPGWKFLGWSTDGKTVVNPADIAVNSSVTYTALYAEVDHIHYMIGYETGIFAPGNGMTRAEAATIFARLTDGFDESKNYTGATFTDVSTGKWYYKYISFAQANKLIKGIDDKTFAPDDYITREQFATMLANFLKIAPIDEKSTFTDVDSKGWASGYIAALQKAGVIEGYDGGKTFGPKDNLQRSQAAKMVNVAIDRVPDKQAIIDSVGTSKFPDVSVDAWYFADVMEATIDHAGVEFHK